MREVKGCFHDFIGVLIDFQVLLEVLGEMVIKSFQFLLRVRLFDLGVDGHLQNFDVLLVNLFVDVLVLLVVSEALAVLLKESLLTLIELWIKNKITELHVYFFVFI